jgi:hypothetical protein
MLTVSRKPGEPSGPGALLLLLGLALSGCGATMADFDRGRGVAAVATIGCYDTMGVLDVRAQKAIQADRRAGKLDEMAATALHREWLQKYDLGTQVCDGGKALVTTAGSSRPIVEMAKNRSKEVAKWFSRFVGLGAHIAAELAQLGLTGGE